MSVGWIDLRVGSGRAGPRFSVFSGLVRSTMKNGILLLELRKTNAITCYFPSIYILTVRPVQSIVLESYDSSLY